MAKRWKRRQNLDISYEDTNTTQSTEQVAKPKMIELSITPYPVQHNNYTPYQTNKRIMSIEDYEAYLVLASMRGYRIGVKVETNYGVKATITGIKNQGGTIDIWGDKTIPDAFLITRDDTPNVSNQCGYGEHELTIL